MDSQLFQAWREKRLRPLAAVDAQGPLEYGNALIFRNKIKAL